ncbi:glycosyltransferase [Candidatus Bathyarchaeota archaeon]|nr:glycosyltransferase [Candidatus Bathyarchaeota archaeon]
MQLAHQGRLADQQEDDGCTPFASIVICTRNRSKYLEKCLPSLAGLDYPNYEIVVVDGSTSHDQRLRNQKIAYDIDARYIFERRKGKSLAQNIGIAAAKGDIIVTTDDDCIPERSWLRLLTQNFTDPSVMCAAGRTKSLFSNELSQLFEELAAFDRGAQRRVFNKKSISLWSQSPRMLSRIFSKQLNEITPAPWGVGYGNNIAYRRTVFYEVGFFDERLGPGTSSAGSEDTDFVYRILKAGYKAVYDPRALIFHQHRDSLPALEQTCHSYGLAQRSFLLKYIRNDPYALFCYIGGIAHLCLVILGHRFKRKGFLPYLTALELCGWLNLRW